MSEKLAVYTGDTNGHIKYNDTYLDMTAEAKRHASNFTWGYAGSGAWATAHTILAHACGKRNADMYTTAFKFGVIAKLDFGEPFTMTRKSVREWLANLIDEMDKAEYRQECIADAGSW